ncbi:MAG: amino acid ABC transporter substrate-binding protein [Methylobacillus sp.]|nr:amino acid ABC transporter substrate-binding protein [Methylobacillus sp.]
MDTNFERRRIMQMLAAASAAAAVPIGTIAAAADGAAPKKPTGKPIVLGLTISTTAAAGVADHADHMNGSLLAQEEINANGGILGRPLELRPVDVDLLSAESCQASIRKLVDLKVHAISSPFLFVPIPAMDASANYKCPYVNGNTQRAATDMVAKHPEKYNHIFQMDPSEVFYGETFPVFLESLADSGNWKPKNNKVHIVQEQIAYCQTISRACQEALKKSRFELAKVTDIQYPVQDWGSVIRDIKKTGAGTVMMDHWVAAEYAAFCKQFRANPLKGTLIYLQYGPSQPEFLELTGKAAEGFVWSTMLGVYADKKGQAFRDKYQKRFPGKTMGLCYTGGGYDIAYMMAQAWNAVGNPDDFKAVNDYIRKTAFRGVCGWSYMNNPRQEARHFPLGTDSIDSGMSQLYFQIQDGKNKIIYPPQLKEADFRPTPWM